MLRRAAVAAIAATIVLACATTRAPASRVTIGMGEQWPMMFSDPYWERLGLRDARVLADWDALSYRRQTAALDAWMASARASRTRVMLSFKYSRHNGGYGGTRGFPTPREFRTAFRAFRKRYPEVHAWTVWNEGNHGHGFSSRHPGRVARLFDVAVRNCPRCRIIGADVLDIPNMIPWVQAFVRHARERPRLWGLHNYLDARRRTSFGTRALLAATRGHIWFTETGAWLLRRRYEPGKPVQEYRRSGRDVARSTRHVLRLACISRRIRRVYFYHWQAPSFVTTWDSGFINARGRPRPAYRVLRRQVRRADGPIVRCRSKSA
jgi:hypothetical protein